jgi:hypothetical protein
MRTFVSDAGKRRSIIIRDSGAVILRHPGQGVLPLDAGRETAVTIGTVTEAGRVWMTVRQGCQAVTVVMPPGGVDAVCEALALSVPIPYVLPGAGSS